MHDHMRILCWHARVSNNVADWDELAVMASHATVRRELARPECCDERCCTIDASIAISRVGSYKFIRVALPIQSIISHKVQQCKLIVYAITISNGQLHTSVVLLTSWDAEHSSDAQLVESLEKVISYLNLRHCVFALITRDECWCQ
jgi:hypothetical protein